MNNWRVALLYNLKHPALVSPDAPPDALAEYDTPETVIAVEKALRSADHEVIALEADYTLLDTIRQVNPDICFNMAKGLNGNERESQVPALLEMLNIPYTGASVLGHARALDKAAAKSTWQDAALPTAPFQVFVHGGEQLEERLAPFPLFVKPLHEGSGMGISKDAIVQSEAELRERVRWVIRTYQQPALVEHYLPGREFTVGIIGNAPATFTGLSLLGKHTLGGRRNGPDSTAGYRLLPILEIDTSVGVGQQVYSAAAKSIPPGQEGAPLYICPARIPPALEKELKRLAVAAFESIGACDVARVDFRLDAAGNPYLLEIDTVPSLDPTLSTLIMMAQAGNVSLTRLVNEILDRALARYSLPRWPLETMQNVSPFSSSVATPLEGRQSR
jgi:D-alanine-D-alanine ligase